MLRLGEVLVVDEDTHEPREQPEALAIGDILARVQAFRAMLWGARGRGLTPEELADLATLRRAIRVLLDEQELG